MILDEEFVTEEYAICIAKLNYIRNNVKYKDSVITKER